MDNELSDRLRLVEDRLEILDILAGSPFSSDVACAPYQNAIYSPNAVLDRDEGLPLYEGRDAIVGIIEGERHLGAIADGMAHIMSLPLIRIDGARAVATCYVQVLVRNKSGENESLADYPDFPGLRIWRLTANRFELERGKNGWQVVKRVIRPVPDVPARDLLRRAMTD